MAQWGYKSKDHGPHTSLIFVPVVPEFKNKVEVGHKLNIKTFAEVGATAAHGYNKKYPITAEGYLSDTMTASEKLNTLSKGIQTLPINNKESQNGYKGGGYLKYGSKAPTLNSIHPLRPPNKIKHGQVGTGTAYLLNGAYPLVDGKLVA